MNCAVLFELLSDILRTLGRTDQGIPPKRPNNRMGAYLSQTRGPYSGSGGCLLLGGYSVTYGKLGEGNQGAVTQGRRNRWGQRGHGLPLFSKLCKSAPLKPKMGVVMCPF